MNKRDAGIYLDTLFGDQRGHVAVAYKDRDSSWQEAQFSWPDERTKLMGWAEVHADANVFICPALRQDEHTRKKGDMVPTRWLWADVDMQNIPAENRSDIEARIKELGTFVVSSGSGTNRHVYVDLGTPVDHTEHMRLNTGLRAYLLADAKHPDNSLLRLPGTTNWKTAAGSPVTIAGGHGRGTSRAALMKRRVFRDVKVEDDWTASEWEFVEPEGLSSRVTRLVNMPTDEAKSRYGNRHKAVWAITTDLIRKGYDADTIHTLMHTFPAALSKAAEENGYDVHRDVDKCVAYFRVVEEQGDNEDGEALEDLDDAAYDRARDAETEEDIEKWALLEFKRNQARKRARQIEAERGWVPPPVDVSWSLTSILTDPPPPAQYLIGIPPGGTRGLCGVRHNVIITAQYKTGKTKFVISTLAKSLCDGTEFMGDIPVHTPPGGLVVGHWNCEMDPAEMASDYVIPAVIENDQNLVGANLRGHRVNILSDQGKAWAVQWLRDRKVKVWTIDSLARLARMAGVSEKDNDEMFDLLMALDEIKVQAEVDVLFLITHTGRAEQEMGKERARGATAIDDWPDARWVMTNEGGVRFLAVDGRGVGMDAAPLIYDEATGHSNRGYGGREEVKNDGAVQTVVRVVRDSPGITSTALLAALKGKMSARVASQYVEDAIEADFIEVRADSSGPGRAAKRHYVKGYEKPEGDRARRATPGEVDMRAVRNRRGSR